MIRTIIETYGLGALSIQQIMGFPKEPKREIIDVDYVDLSDEIESTHQLPNESKPILQPILIETYADTDNQ